MNSAVQKPELLKLNDIVSFYHIQMPHWLFADNRYNTISLPAKVAYSLLLNRHQLSKMHGWINGEGEVYIIYPREELAATLQVGAQKAISIFKELADAGLVWEVRRGNNKANHIYLTRIDLSKEDAYGYDNAPFISQPVSDDDLGSAEYACPDLAESRADADTAEAILCHGFFGHTKNTLPDIQYKHIRTYENGASGGLKNAAQDMRKSHPSHIYHSHKDNSQIDMSQYVSPMHELERDHAHIHTHARDKPDRQTDDELAELDEILERCELWTFEPETAKVFSSAIERLYFTEKYRIGGCILPQIKVRSHLYELDQIKLQTAEQKIAANTENQIRNTTAYTMAVIFNSIWEACSDIMLDPYLNSLRVESLSTNYSGEDSVP